MTKKEEQVIRQVIARLRGERASEPVRKALTEDARLYLETWVIPALEWMLPEQRDIDAAVRQSQ